MNWPVKKTGKEQEHQQVGKDPENAAEPIVGDSMQPGFQGYGNFCYPVGQHPCKNRNKTVHFTKQDNDGIAQDISFTMTVSTGVSKLDYGWKDVDPEKLIGSSLICNPQNAKPHYKLTCKISESADEALYNAKERGRNQICVYEDS